MPRLVKFVTVTFDSFWTSGEITLKERKALSFARSLSKNHKKFIKDSNWNGKWHGHLITDDRLKFKISFTTFYAVVTTKRKKIVKKELDFAI